MSFTSQIALLSQFCKLKLHFVILGWNQLTLLMRHLLASFSSTVQHVYAQSCPFILCNLNPSSICQASEWTLGRRSTSLCHNYKSKRLVFAGRFCYIEEIPRLAMATTSMTAVSILFPVVASTLSGTPLIPISKVTDRSSSPPVRSLRSCQTRTICVTYRTWN